MVVHRSHCIGIRACVVSGSDDQFGGVDVTRRWALQLAAILAAGSVVLCGCSEKQEASDTLPTTSAPKTTSALPPLGPEGFPVPREAREKTTQGAVEFVRYYVSLTKYLAEHSLSADPLLDLSQDCRSCTNIAKSLEDDRTANYRYTEYISDFKENGPALLDGDTAQMGFLYSQGPVTAVDQSGVVVPERSTVAAEQFQSGAILRWRSDLTSWVITELTVG